MSCTVCCKVAKGDNTTELKPRCECVNECKMISFSPTISSGKLSPDIIFDNIPDSSDISEGFVAATETRHRVEVSLMMKTVKLLSDAVEAHRKMRYQINTDIVDAGTSWTSALSKLFTNLGEMIRSHIADSISLLSILSDVYTKHVNYLVTGLSTQLQDCDSLTAEVHAITIRAQSTTLSSTEVGRLQLLRNSLEYLQVTLDHFEPMLNAEARKSSLQLHYFPNPLHVDLCMALFQSVDKALKLHIQWLYSFIPTVSGANVSRVDDIVFTNMTIMRSLMEELSECLMSCEKELHNFEDELSSVQASTLEAAFKYEPPTTSLRRFIMDGSWLESITIQYIANEISKLELATALSTNGSEVLTSSDRLYSDLELSLFTKASNLIDQQETDIVSFYKELLQRVTALQSYMFANDTELEQFMRRISIWRMPIVNFQKSQVSVMLVSVDS